MLRHATSLLCKKAPTRVSFSQMSLGATGAVAPVAARAANAHTFDDSSEQNAPPPIGTPSASQLESTWSAASPAGMTSSSSRGASAQQGQQTGSAASPAGGNKKSSSPLPDAVASMSDAEFDENVTLLKQIAKKSMRSFGIFFVGIIALWYAKRTRLNTLPQQQGTATATTAGAESATPSTEDEKALERFIGEMRKVDWAGDKKDDAPEPKAGAN